MGWMATEIFLLPTIDFGKGGAYNMFLESFHQALHVVTVATENLVANDKN
jgi:hypothetical protein